MTYKIILSLLVNTAVFSVLFCAALLIRKTAGRKISPALKLALWAVVLIKLVMPFGFESGLSILPATAPIESRTFEQTQAADGTTNAYVETIDTIAPESYSVDTPGIQPEQNNETAAEMDGSRPVTAAGIDWTVIALCVWGAGAMAVSLVLCMSAINLRRRISHARMETPHYITQLAEQCKKELGIRREIKITVQSALGKPVIMGAVRPVLVLPDNAKLPDKEALRHVLLHELTHFKGGDLWAIKFMNMLRALYWFNPLVWAAFRLIREDIESACDQRVIKALGQRNRLSYIETVLSFAGRSPSDRFAAAMGLFDGRPSMERRIKGMFGKTKTGIKGRITAGLVAALILAVSALTACQPAAAEAMNIERKQSEWVYNKEYGRHRSLNVDAAVYSADAETLPILNVVPEPFESGEKIKSITNLFCPNAKIYEQGGKFTTEQIEQAIAEAQQEGLTDVVEYYEQQLPEATDSLNEASYQLINVHDGSMQANMIAESGDSISYVDFVNWNVEKGSCFYYNMELFDSGNSDIYDRLVTPESLKDDSGFRKAKEKADERIKGMGIDYMTVNSVNRGEGSYSLYYTRAYDGLPETYVEYHTGATVGINGDPEAFLWVQEYLNIVIQNDEIVAASWENPSEIKSVDSESSTMLPLEQVKEIFLKQMDTMMAVREPYNSKTHFFRDGAEVIINRVELGYTKLLTEGTTDDYKLVPTWMFMGYEKSTDYYSSHYSTNIGAEMCFMTINATDGTVVDRGRNGG